MRDTQTLIIPPILTDSTNMSSKVTITLPTKTAVKIDRDRGDVPRSRFILRLIEKAQGMGVKD